MRVLLACPYAWEVPGGVQAHVRELAERLADGGHGVLVLAPGSRPAPEPWVRVVGRPVRVPYGGKIAPICFSWSSRRRVGALLRRFDPDVVHAHEPFSPSTSMLAVLASRAPTVATFHAFHERARLLRLAAPLLRRVDRGIAARIAVSGVAAGFAARVCSGPIEVIPNGVDVERFAHPVSEARGLPPGRRVLWVNRLDPQKGFPVLVRAFSRLAPEFPDLALVVVGDGGDRGAVRMLERDEAARVVMLGSVPSGDLPPYHAAADVFASPATGHESFGIALVEAMAAGVPVVASDIDGYRDVVRDGAEGLLVPPGDPDALARAIARVLREPGLAEGLAAAGRERAAGFAWDRVVPRIEEVYERVSGRTA